ncbi:glycosyltransferase family 4 protein [Candidatus Gracilibacteria bacterium]|nr:glycosyltransferase family 4 protein [Candidatus Gracilibacteria bacterium]
MKIGIDASRFGGEEATGVEWYSHHIITELVKILPATYEVVLYTRSPIRLAHGANVRVKQIERRRLWTILGLSLEMWREKPDVLFVPSHTLPLCLAPRTVTMIHDTAFRHFRRAYGFFQYHYLNWSTKFAVKRAKKILVPSKATADDLVKLFGCRREKIVVVQHGFGVLAEAEYSDVLERFGLREKKFLLFVGRLEMKKNLQRLVEAFKFFSTKYTDFYLVLAGKRGLGFQQIWRTVVEYGLENRVIMPGYITESEKVFLLARCEAFVFPSLYEGFGLPLLEAFAVGKPVLCSTTPALKEVGGDSVVYCDPLDSRDIERGLEEVLAFDGEKGRARLKDFSWQKAAEETLKTLHG